MLAGAGLRNDACLSHAPREQHLAKAIVDLVRAGVVEVFALQIDLCAAQMRGQALGEIERTLPPDIGAQETGKLRVKGGIAARLLVGAFEFQNERHQGLCNEPAAIAAEMPARIGTGTVGIGPQVHVCDSGMCAEARAFAMNARIRSGLFCPGDPSTPDDTSTARAPLTATARATFSGVRPPARSQGR